MKITKQPDGTYRLAGIILYAKSGRKYWVTGAEKWMTPAQIMVYAGFVGKCIRRLRAGPGWRVVCGYTTNNGNT